jgi:hypothetical protein
LTGNINEKELTVGVEVIGYAENSFQFVFCFFQGSSMNEYYITMQSMSSEKWACNGWYNLVVAGGGVIVRVYESFAARV